MKRVMGLFVAGLVLSNIVLPRTATAAMPAYDFDQILPKAQEFGEITERARSRDFGARAYKVLDKNFIEELKKTSKKLSSTVVTVGVDLSQRGGGSQGSGVIIRPTGYIVTNDHVIHGANTLDVRLSDKRVFKAKVIGRDVKSDLAVLKIDAGTARLPYAQWGDSKIVSVGDFVIAIGSPFGLEQTTTFGFVNASGRRGLGMNWYEDYIQIQAPINPGNSGGGLFLNNTQLLIGINGAIFTQSGVNSGIGFAIPAHIAKRVTDEIIATGRVNRGKLGLTLEGLDLDRQKLSGAESGVFIAKVEDGSGAADAGVKEGDVVVEIDGVAMGDVRQLMLFVADFPKDSVIVVTVIRQGKTMTMNMTLK